MTRRRFLASLASAVLFGSIGLTPRHGFASPSDPNQRSAAIKGRLRDVEDATRGRLGVHILDTATGQEYGYRSDERFMMLSAFKLLACALVLHRVDAGHESLERRIPYTKQDMVTWSPVPRQHADGKGMTLA